MQKILTFLLLLGLTQCSTGQFEDYDFLKAIADFDESSGDSELTIFNRDDLEIDTPSRECGRFGWGYNCRYPQIGYTPAVPMDQWKDFVPGGKKICSMFGRQYIMTFDRSVAIYDGTCEVLVSTLCDDPESPSIWLKRSAIECDNCISQLRIKIGMHEIILNGDVILNDEIITSKLPVGVDGIDMFNIESLVVLTWGEIEVRFNVHTSVARLFLPEAMSSRTCGLCGNMNGETSDDVTERSRPALISHFDSKCSDSPPSEKLDFVNACTKYDSTHRICNILISEAFSSCMTVLDPTPFYEICLIEICKGDTWTQSDLLCNITTEYTNQCALNGGHPTEWRSLANCVQTCPTGMQWSECADPFATCAVLGNDNNFQVMYRCSEGCECIEGTYMQDGNCIEAENCKCEMQGEYYNPGSTLEKPCGNTCTCTNGHWKCSEISCNGVASAVGMFHYITFDGRHFTYRDSCSVIFAKDCVDNDFMVLISYEEHQDVFYKNIIVAVKTGESWQKYTLRRDGKIDNNGKRVNAPLNTGVVDIRRGVDNIYLTIVGKDVHITYDMVSSVVVNVPSSYKEKMCGLAGNYNDKKVDDFELKSKYSVEDVTMFADDWKWTKSCKRTIPDIGETELCSQSATGICRKMFDYAMCKDNLQAMTSCVADICSLSLESLQNEFACSSTRGFATYCMEKADEAFVLSLEDTECRKECPDGLEYQTDNSECSHSCAAFMNFCIEVPQAGCFCPEGTFINDDGVCVEQDECSCLFDGTWYEKGVVTSIPNNDCSCFSGVMTCTEINETISCQSSGMQYYSCEDPYDTEGAACEKTCYDIQAICMAGACMTGCACKPGLYLTPDEGCVPKEKCGCYAGEKYYKNGESFKDDCNTVTCIGGTFTRTDLVCPKTCWAVGASHYKSFDGLRYDFEGDCEYILATDYCPNNRNGGMFSVHTKNTNCGTNGMTCSKYLIVTVKNQKITLERGRKPVIETIASTRFRRAITGFTDHDVAEIFTIKQKGIFTIVDTCIGMTVLWDNGTRIYIRLTEEFQGTTCGMCGDYNGKDGDDLRMSTGMQNENIVEFGNSWKFPPLTTTCVDSTLSTQINASCTESSRREWAINKCRVISDTKGVFASCHNKVNPSEYFDMCVHDACGCDGGGDCECLCTAISHYAHECAQQKAVIEWRSNELCPIMCEQYNDNEDVCLWHYRPCATCITDTCCDCQQPEDTHWCVEGCFPKCPTGFILDEMTQTCIKQSERDTKCTWYSNENMCHTCEQCEVCKTKTGATLRIEPGQTIFFPIATDACEREWCARETTGDLCYNGTISWYDCNEEYEPIPYYDPRYYTQTCWNSTLSECSNCRDCKNECRLRNDSCDAGKSHDSDPWLKVFPVLPTPEKGAKTYCMRYKCNNHTEAIDPQCYIQTEERVECKHNIDEVICEEHEILKIYPTGDECCPEKYECVCEVCALNENGAIQYMKTIESGETKDWCMDEESSNCCFTDTCSVDENREDKTICPVVTRLQAPCTTGPAPTCSPGFVWTNLTRPADCCPWGECECDACYDYDTFNNKVLKLVGDVWNKKCMKFKCVRGTRGDEGCYRTKNFENITCVAKPECKSDEYVKIVGIDEWECCDIYDCVCYDQCHVTIDGTERVVEPGQQFVKDDGCWYTCVDPRTSPEDKNCPRSEKTCHPPTDCGECEFIADTVNDTCGCTQYECQTIERCPSAINCPFPYVRVVNSTVDKCKTPCYDCECKECWDQYQNRTYNVDKTWRRQYIDSAKCEDCTCTNNLDEDGCLKEECTLTPCPAADECQSPYDTAIYGENECGCKILLGCKCPHCAFEGKIIEGKKFGDRWTVGDFKLGCYDTYECLTLKRPSQEKECFNVTKFRNPCVVTECPEDHIAVENKALSCVYDDEEICRNYDCECVKCQFNGKSYDPGQTWTKDCIDYVCTNETDTSNSKRCLKIESSVVKCPSADLDCKKCYVQYLNIERDVPDQCCDIWDCKPQQFCVNEINERVDNGTIWNTEECRRVQCIVSEKDWANGICPEIVEIDHCDPDPTTCNECQEKTITQDKCGCEKIICPPTDPPNSCKDPAENMFVEYFNTGDNCYSTKNCCVCDDACYYNGVRKDIFSVWMDKSTCQRLRCVPPDSTLLMFGFDPSSIYLDDIDDVVTSRLILSKLNYRKMLSDMNIPKSIYADCSQEQSLCPVTIDLGCAKPKECGECEHTKESVDECGCPVLACTPYVCPPPPYDINLCSEPKVVMENISLAGLTELYPCCNQGRICKCRNGCEDTNSTLREIGEIWTEVGTNECGRTHIRKKCQAPSEFVDPKPDCPQEVSVPCLEPVQCGNCENRTSFVDDFCCEIASCEPLNKPVECVEPKQNQRISTLETGDECFPSKQCCACDTTCSYKSEKYQLFQVWEDAENCARMRCVLPEETIRALGYSGKIDFKDLEDEMEAKFNELKSEVDFRKMMSETKISHKLYEQCQQNISLCPMIYDMGCKPVQECDECHITNITKDSCGCDVATCTLVERCPFVTCSFPKRSREISDADPCKAPCYKCSCDHICLDNFDNSTHEPDMTWKRTYREPERKCETCTCTNDKDEKDDCLKEICEPIPCPIVAECDAPYNKAIYGTDDCGCQLLIDCECTQCMYEGEVVPNRTRGESWTEGNVALGCYDTYQCNPIKDSGKSLECYEVTRRSAECIVDDNCTKDHVAVKNEEKSCCFEETCCPRYDCKCVKCRFGNESYDPGQTWKKDCIDYTCTNVTDETDIAKCKLITSKQSPCESTKPVCENCYVEYLATTRDVSNNECCNIWGCKPENVCIKEDGTRVPNGTIWMPDKCQRFQCFVSEEDWTNGICPQPAPRDHCIADLSVSCPPCTDKTIVKDECGCDSVTCPPIEEPAQCTVPAKTQVMTTLATENNCHPSKNCCMCDNSCYYRGVKKALFSVWIDEVTCERMRCVPPESVLVQLGFNASSIDFKDVDNVELWNDIRSKIDYRQLLIDSKIPTKLYDECSQDTSLCPTAKSIGCQEPTECPECTDTITSEDKCGCPVNACQPFQCPPSPYDVAECFFPKSNLVEISLKGLTEKYPCCSVGQECVCHLVCFDYQNKSRAIGDEWEEPSEYQCSSDPSASGSIVRKRCNPGIQGSTKDDEVCPHTKIIPCENPANCNSCEEEIRSLDEYCCPVVTCNKINCDINVLADCVLPKVALKSDATVTEDECCPKYCDCPDKCTESETGKQFDRNLAWPHPLSVCWTRTCIVDSTRRVSEGCPYIVNRTVCTEPIECDICYSEKDSVDACGCTTRKCERNPCPITVCEDDCDEIYDTNDVGSCGCPVLECRPKPCPTKLITCGEPEKNVYSWMDMTVDKCCKQQGCRCNYTKCIEPDCPVGQVAVRNISATKCCCPEYMCVPNDNTECTDYNGIPRKIGVPWINKDNNCKMLQCSYQNTKSRTSPKIEEFNRFLCSSEKTSCVNGGLAYLASTKEGCCREWVCPCTCQVYGDPHFTTFDGFSYDFQGKCTYTLMKEYLFNQTEVIVDNELCKWQSARSKSLSCLKTMTVLHKGINHTFTFGHKFELNGEEINVRKPWASSDGDVTVREFGYKQLKLQIKSLGLDIVYKTRLWMQSLILTIPYESLEGKMLGLCGSCNNDPSDEFRNTAYGVLTLNSGADQETIDKFAEGWIKNVADHDQPKCFPTEPVCPEDSVFPDCGKLPTDECINCENKCHLSHPKCNSCEVDPCQVLQTNKVFKEANSHIDPRIYMAMCAYDLSQENNITNKCDACFSPSVAQYAALNEMHGLCIPWRSALGCEETTCPDKTQEYRECDLDAKRDLSCDLLILNITDSVNVEGCFCPEGTIRRSSISEECVPLKCCHGCSESPTCEDGSVAIPGEKTDDCGCPIYMCSDVAGCEVEEKQQLLEINVNGKVCKSPEMVVSADCAGNCAVSTRAVNGEFDTECSKCEPTTTVTRNIILECNDGSSEKYNYDIITACECSSFSCSNAEMIVGSGDITELP